MLAIFKKKISSQEMASGMYMLFIRDTVKDAKKDADKNIILTKDEQKLLLLAHLCQLLDLQDLTTVKVELLSIFVRDNRKIKSEANLVVEMLVIIESVEKIQHIFEHIKAKEYHDFLENDFLKKLNPVQKMIALNWYIGRMQAIDAMFKSALRKFHLKDK